jgi:hypothetical protein
MTKKLVYRTHKGRTVRNEVPADETDEMQSPMQQALEGLKALSAKLEALISGKANDETDPDKLPDDEAVKAMSQQVESNDSDLVKAMKAQNAEVARRQRKQEATRTGPVRNAVVSNDPAVRAMSQFSSDDAVLQAIKAKKR